MENRKNDKPIAAGSDQSTNDNEKRVFISNPEKLLSQATREKIFMAKLKAKEKEIQDYKTFAEGYKSTTQMIKQKLLIGESDKRLMQAIRFNEKN